MKKTGLAVLSVAALALPLAGQNSAANERVARALGNAYAPPLCSLKNDFRTSSAGTYLKTAINGVEGGSRPDPKVRASLISKAQTSSLEAVKANDKSAAGWYYLARTDLMLGDVFGADTAFTRVVALAPECAEDVKGWRQKAWIALINPAAEMSRANQNDSALIMFRAANTISQAHPAGFFNTAVIYANANQNDSAAYYFARSLQIAEKDSVQFRKERSSSAKNLASINQSLGKNAEALALMQRYVAWEPTDRDSKRILSQMLRVSGKTAEADQMDKDILAASAAAGTLTSNDYVNMGVQYFNDKKFDEAADAFSKALAADPGDHTAMLNLANTYYAAKKVDLLLPAAEQLLVLEPLNESAMKLQGGAYQLSGKAKEKELLASVEALLKMPTMVLVSGFSPSADGARLVGVATGREAQDAAGKKVAPAARTLVFEFVGKDGAVVTSQEVQIQPLEPGKTQDITVDAKGQAITGWRYRIK